MSDTGALADKARRNINAAEAGIMAAIRVGGPRMDVGDLVAGIVAIARTLPGFLADQMVDIVTIVGARRAHEIVDAVAKAGAGDSFS